MLKIQGKHAGILCAIAKARIISSLIIKPAYGFGQCATSPVGNNDQLICEGATYILNMKTAKVRELVNNMAGRRHTRNWIATEQGVYFNRVLPSEDGLTGVFIGADGSHERQGGRRAIQTFWLLLD